jgi:diguanylate cyclase (GGDEF)-like protein
MSVAGSAAAIPVFMFDRLVSRAAFWGGLVILTATCSMISVGENAAVVATPVHRELAGLGLWPSAGTLTAIGMAAPALSLLALVAALAGWRLLHGELARDAERRRVSHAQTDRLQTMMRANGDGVVLLRPVRNARDVLVDFVIDEVNDTGARLVRTARHHMVGQRLLRDAAPTLPAIPFETYAAVLETATAHREQLRVSRRRFDASWLSHEVVPVGDGLVVTLRDISAQKRHERALRRASITDDLTGLYNRRGFLASANAQLDVARREQQDVALLYVDMDDFKALNDRYGHREGDRALRAVGRLLRRAVRDCDLVARMGGDEFTIMAMSADSATARLIQRRIEERIALLNASGDLAMPLSLTIGHTRVRGTDHAPVTELLARADALLFSRKRRRKAALLAARQAEARTGAPAASAAASGLAGAAVERRAQKKPAAMLAERATLGVQNGAAQRSTNRHTRVGALPTSRTATAEHAGSNRVA